MKAGEEEEEESFTKLSRLILAAECRACVYTPSSLLFVISRHLLIIASAAVMSVHKVELFLVAIAVP